MLEGLSDPHQSLDKNLHRYEYTTAGERLAIKDNGMIYGHAAHNTLFLPLSRHHFASYLYKAYAISSICLYLLLPSRRL